MLVEFFEAPIFLVLLFGLIIFLIIVIFNRVKLNKLFTGNRLKLLLKKNLIRNLFYAISYCLLVLALAKPSFITKKIAVKQNGTELFFLLDISNSMNIKDIGKSRLEISKAIIKTIKSNLLEIKSGLILFKGTAVVSLPLTNDKEIFDVMLSNISSQSLSSAGTNLEAGINLAIKNFSENDSVQKIILLLTDGDETLGKLKNSSKNLNEKNIVCMCIGVGTTTGKEIKVYNKDKNLETIITKLCEDDLKKFIESINDKNSCYLNYSSLNLVGIITEKILSINSSTRMLTTIKKINHTNLFLFFSLFFLLLGFLFGEYECIKE